MSVKPLEFESPIIELEEKLEAVRAKAKDGDENAKNSIPGLEAELLETRKKVYANLTPWERVLFARHPDRPHTLDYINALTTEFVELHGDRNFGDDKAIIGGMARFQGQPVIVLGQQKGKDTKELAYRNFGMMHPEGYRKALRLMRMADKFSMPIIIFVDTPGAFPGLGAEERGQAEAIAFNIQEMMGLKVPIIMTVIGEGASGGALGIGLADRVMMMQNAWYCVISPEGCASILWKSADEKARAAEVLKLTADDLMSLKIIDEIVPEPLGGAHRFPDETFANLEEAIARNLKELSKLKADKLMDLRFDKYRNMGVYTET